MPPGLGAAAGAGEADQEQGWEELGHWAGVLSLRLKGKHLIFYRSKAELVVHGP